MATTFMEGMMAPPPFWLDYAAFNSCYAEWLTRVEQICDHVLNVRFRDFVYEVDPHDSYYEHKSRPERFVAEVLVPYLEYEHGAEQIYSMLADNIMWGRQYGDIEQRSLDT